MGQGGRKSRVLSSLGSGYALMWAVLLLAPVFSLRNIHQSERQKGPGEKRSWQRDWKETRAGRGNALAQGSPASPSPGSWQLPGQELQGGAQGTWQAHRVTPADDTPGLSSW